MLINICYSYFVIVSFVLTKNSYGLPANDDWKIVYSNLLGLLVPYTLAPEVITTTTEKPQLCGRRVLPPSPLILDGQPTKPGEYPWHAAIFRIDTIVKKKNYICGGTLLSENRIVTASHCVHEKRIQVEPSRLSVILGKYNLFEEEDVAQKTNVSDIIVHPSYDKTTLANDIAILKLNIRLTYTDFVRPICLWESNKKAQIVHQFGLVIGWGFNNDNQLSSVLAEAKLFITNDLECVRSNPLFYVRFVSDNTFCAGNKNTTSVCNGDSGSGMFFSEKMGEDDVWFLRGLVSLGGFKKDSDRCDPQQYVVFTYVDDHLNFIRSHM